MDFKKYDTHKPEKVNVNILNQYFLFFRSNDQVVYTPKPKKSKEEKDEQTNRIEKIIITIWLGLGALGCFSIPPAVWIFGSVAAMYIGAGLACYSCGMFFVIILFNHIRS